MHPEGEQKYPKIGSNIEQKISGETHGLISPANPVDLFFVCVAVFCRW